MKPERRSPIEIQLVFVALGDDLVVCGRYEVSRRIVRSWQLGKREVAVPFILARAARHRQKSGPAFALWRPARRLPSDVAVHVGVNQILRRHAPSLERFQKLSPVCRAIERERCKITSRSGLHANPMKRISAMQSRVFEDNRTVPRKLQLEIHRLATFYLDAFV